MGLKKYKRYYIERDFHSRLMEIDREHSFRVRWNGINRRLGLWYPSGCDQFILVIDGINNQRAVFTPNGLMSNYDFKGCYNKMGYVWL